MTIDILNKNNVLRYSFNWKDGLSNTEILKAVVIPWDMLGQLTVLDTSVMSSRL